MRHVHDARHVDVEHQLPLLDRRVERRPWTHHSRVVDEDVEAAELGYRSCDGLLRLLPLRDVRLDHERATTDLVGELPEPYAPPRDESDRGAPPCEHPRSRRTDPAARAGDERHRPVEPGHSGITGSTSCD